MGINTLGGAANKIRPWARSNPGRALCTYTFEDRSQMKPFCSTSRPIDLYNHWAWVQRKWSASLGVHIDPWNQWHCIVCWIHRLLHSSTSHASYGKLGKERAVISLFLQSFIRHQMPASASVCSPFKSFSCLWTCYHRTHSCNNGNHSGDLRNGCSLRLWCFLMAVHTLTIMDAACPLWMEMQCVFLRLTSV